jgi:phosphoribosylanthranilate isomerase
VDNDFILRTQQVWQPRSPRKLTREDAKQIVSNAVSFFAVLAEWDQEDRRRSQAQSGAPDTQLERAA